MSPKPAKQCEGQFAEDVQQALANDKNRARRMDHPCQACGLTVSAQFAKGHWIPDQHWPSVRYVPKKPRRGPERPNTAVRYSRIDGSVLNR